MWSLTVLMTIQLSNCSITFWLLLWDSIWLLILYGTCNWYSPEKSPVHFSLVTAPLEQQEPLLKEEDAPCYYPTFFSFLFFHVLLYKYRKYKYCLLPIPVCLVPHHLATEIICHILFSSPSFKLSILQLSRCSWLLSPAVKTRGTVLEFKFKCLLNKQNSYCLTLNILVL